MIDNGQDAQGQFLDPPRACGSELEREPWAGSFALSVRDDKYVGVRTNSAPLLDLLRAMFGRQVADGVAVQKHYYSVKVGQPGRRSRTPMHYLYTGGRVAVGTRDLRRLVLALGQHVRAHEHHDGPEYIVEGIPVIGPRGTVLAPAALRGATAAVDRLLVQQGAALYDGPYAWLDSDTVAVVIPTPPSSVPDHDALSSVGPSLQEPSPDPGGYRMSGWLLDATVGEVGPLRPALGAYRSMGLLSQPFPRGARRALEDMVAVASQAGLEAARWRTPEDLVALVAAKVL